MSRSRLVIRYDYHNMLKTGVQNLSNYNQKIALNITCRRCNPDRLGNGTFAPGGAKAFAQAKFKVLESRIAKIAFNAAFCEQFQGLVLLIKTKQWLFTASIIYFTKFLFYFFSKASEKRNRV